MLNLSLGKVTQITEKQTIELRVEMQNAFNSKHSINPPASEPIAEFLAPSMQEPFSTFAVRREVTRVPSSFRRSIHSRVDSLTLRKYDSFCRDNGFKSVGESVWAPLAASFYRMWKYRVLMITFYVVFGHSSFEASSTPFDDVDRRRNYTPSDFDRTQVFQAVFPWQRLGPVRERLFAGCTIGPDWNANASNQTALGKVHVLESEAMQPCT